ncbi:UbiA prenyltransferase family [Calycina marina]|uniref:UbiA prenyltransferase family n=1 Tax=Calycina marina TaxID=1763456 RepID=A0A9P7Z1I9_9HELO|nr:UbiA prenyltransferase family [Calycina marina]
MSRPPQASLGYFMYTLFLFTKSDSITFMLPEALFGICGALSGPLITTNPKSHPADVLFRVPKVFLWVWLNLLIFTLANQRLPGSIIEDRINKPFRPLPAGRITASQTTRLLLFAIVLVLGVTYFWLGSFEETLLLLACTWMYNDLEGGEDFVGRNILLAFIYTLYGSGSLRVAVQSASGQKSMSLRGYLWSGVVGGIILTTMQVQDLKDQKGDKLRKRRTAPLVLGDRFTRWTIAIPVALWSVFCPIFWTLGRYLAIPPVSLGFVVAARVVSLDGVSNDRRTWKLWCYWLILLYFLPAAKNHFS